MIHRVSPLSRHRLFLTGAFSLLTLAVSGCGGGADSAKLLESGPVPAAVTQAEQVDLKDFPKASGRTIGEVASAAGGEATFGPANGTFVPGSNRIAFALIGADGRPLYAPSVVYVASSVKGIAQGPFPAPADPMVPQQAYLSKTAAASSGDLKAIYEAEVPLPSAGKWQVLTLSKASGGLVGAASAVEVAASSDIPAVGQRPPKIDTPTVASSGGKIASIDTRDPHATTLHEQNFADVVGKQPVALLFATPQLCQSRVCGPVTDLLLQLQAYYGKRVVAIQQEVYNDNDLNKGLRPQLEAFNLVTEPWLFTVGADGLIKARLEGAFGLNAMNRAIKAALPR